MVVDLITRMSFSSAAHIAQNVLCLETGELRSRDNQMAFQIQPANHIFGTGRQLKICAKRDCAPHHRLRRVHHQMKKVFHSSFLHVNRQN